MSRNYGKPQHILPTVFEKESKLYKKSEVKSMPRKKAPSEPTQKYDLPKMLTLEGTENVLCAKALEVAYQRMCDGTASSQEIVHFLRLASTKHQTEMAILENQKDLLAAKTHAIEQNDDFKKITEDAIIAMSEYKGSGMNDAD